MKLRNTSSRRALCATLTGALMVGAALAQDADAEVTRIDRAQGRLTLRHGEIRNLEMPPMTMVFRVRDPKMIEGLAVGDKVRFSAEKIGGHYTVTLIVKAP